MTVGPTPPAMPTKSADLVLQGGVTSAFVYIGLIHRLSRHYHFKCLGGASSGAVAAAAAAIAEHSRLHPPAGARFDPFERLRKFPQVLAKLDKHGDTALFNLFQAQPASARAWRVVSAAVRRLPDGLWAATRAAAVAAVGAFPWAAGLGLALGALPAFALFAQRGGPMDLLAWLSLGGAVLAGLLLAGLGLLIGVGWAIWRSLVANHFGLCSGMGETHAPGPPDPDRLPLSWAFHALFCQLAGRELDAAPITFGELWGDDDKRREIDLQVITTSLSLQRPFRLPGDPGVNPLQAFFYDPAEWRAFFPGPVLKWLMEKRLSDGAVPVTNAAGVALFALPEPRDWPVLLAARLSLSFPVLLSAVPMYTLDGTRDRRHSATGPTRFVARRVYFSDGGITNNCPVQLFDAALPRRPTFVVRLAKLPAGFPKRWRVWLQGDAGDPPPRVRPINGVPGFAGSIVGTLMGWRDQLQADLPGYRERVATVGLKAAEGGLNLAMPPATILALSRLGGVAAHELAHAFNGPRTRGRVSGWDRHRWVRMRSTLAAAQRYVGEIARGMSEADAERSAARAAGEPSYPELLAQRPPLSPPFVDADAVAQAQALLVACEGLAGTLDLSGNAPEPAPRLRMSSPW